jgi:trigger factor
LDEALVGLSAEETTTFEDELAGGEHAGETALVTVTVRSVKERELPAVDEEFTQLASEFDTVEELREGTRRRLERIAGAMRLGNARRALVETLVEAAEVPVPEGVVATIVAHRWADGAGDGEQADAEEVAREATAEVRRDLTLDLLAEQLDVEVTRDDLARLLAQRAIMARMDPSEFVERAQEAGVIPGFVSEIGRSKAVDAALEAAAVVDESGNPLDVAVLLAEEAEDIEEDYEDEE